jgi:hypothetical protein
MDLSPESFSISSLIVLLLSVIHYPVPLPPRSARKRTWCRPTSRRRFCSGGLQCANTSPFRAYVTHENPLAIQATSGAHALQEA